MTPALRERIERLAEPKPQGAGAASEADQFAVEALDLLAREAALQRVGSSTHAEQT